MSSDPHPPGPDAHDDHAFTGEPVRVVAPDEPRTPGWLPLLGVALFTGAAVVVLVGHDPEVAAAASAAAPQAAAPGVTAPPPAARPPPPSLGAPLSDARPSASALPKLTPEQRDRMRKLLDASKNKAPGAH